MYTLYWSPGSANMTPHAMLEEIGAPHELIKVETAKGDQRKPDYLKINPHGRVPTLAYDDGKIIYEAAAISLFLAERHPEIGLAPPPGHPDRGPFLQWMAYLTNTVQEACTHWWRPSNFFDDADRQADLKRSAERRLAKMFAFLDGHLGASGPHLCGAKFYACDYYAVMLAQWTEDMATPADTFGNVRKLIETALARPAYRRMLAAEGLSSL